MLVLSLLEYLYSKFKINPWEAEQNLKTLLFWKKITMHLSKQTLEPQWWDDFTNKATKMKNARMTEPKQLSKQKFDK